MNRAPIAPILRGVYFTSGVQEGRPLDRVVGAMGRGIFLEGLKEDDAKALVRRLADDGIAADAVDAADLPTFPPPRKMLQLECGDDLLLYGDGEALRFISESDAGVGGGQRSTVREVSLLGGAVDALGLPAQFSQLRVQQDRITVVVHHHRHAAIVVLLHQAQDRHQRLRRRETTHVDVLAVGVGPAARLRTVITGRRRQIGAARGLVFAHRRVSPPS